MSTQIIHYRNSFIEVSNSKIRILMDPWVYSANHGSWAGTKKGAIYIIDSLKKRPIDYIYFSHLHTDHYDERFLEQLAKKNKKTITIIVKKFKDQRFKKKIQSLCKKNIKVVEVDCYKKLILSDKSKIWILPQLSSSNTPNYLINYDLDTSCIFQNEDLCLFNQTDNPYSEKDIGIIQKKLKKNSIPENFDIAFIPYCAASAYPQNFININRAAIKKQLIASRLLKFFNVSKKLNAKLVIPAGGSYKLDKNLVELNKYLAIPNYRFIKNFKEKIKSKINLVDTNKKYFLFNHNNYELKNKNFAKFFEDKILTSKLTYPNCKSFNKEVISKDLAILESRLPEWKKNIYHRCQSEVHLHIHKDDPKNKKMLKKGKFVVHKINFGNNNKKNFLKIFLNYKLLYALINGNIVFNEIETHLLYSRKPNIYEPDVVFWMNLYKY